MRIHGSKGQVVLADSPEVILASLNAWSLDMKRDRADVTSFGDTNKTYVLGLKDISGTLGGFYDSEDGSGGNMDLFDVADGDDPVTLKLVPSTNASTHFWSGLAYLDASIQVSATGAVTISGSFVAGGAWSRV